MRRLSSNSLSLKLTYTHQRQFPKQRSVETGNATVPIFVPSYASQIKCIPATDCLDEQNRPVPSETPHLHQMYPYAYVVHLADTKCAVDQAPKKLLKYAFPY